MAIEIVNVESWEEFEEKLDRLFKDVKKQQDTTGSYVSQPLFRGHSCGSWKLQTTLERYSLAKQYTIGQYFGVMQAIKPAVESMTKHSWSLKNVTKPDEGKIQPPAGYDFMVYLRHHGFPSPLLDWSTSPYIAAFFAFQATAHSRAKDSVAIYSFVEYYDGGKTWEESDGTIIGCGPYVSTHKRHFSQQCQYTFCRKKVDIDFVYCNHEDILSGNRERQDMLTKYIMPSSERVKVLQKLHLMNINSYSLFGNEESLMESLAYQEIWQKIKS